VKFYRLLSLFSICFLTSVCCAEQGAQIVEYPALSASVQPYRGHYNGAILPSPHGSELSEEFLPVYDLDSNVPLASLLVSDNPSRLERIAAVHLSIQPAYLAGRTAFDLGESVAVPLPIFSGDVLPNATGAVICIGDDFAKFLSDDDLEALSSVSDKPEAYLIRSVTSEGRNLTIVVGGDDLGVLHGVRTLLQLMRIGKQNIEIQKANIDDWPQYKIRGVQYEGAFGPDSIEAIDAFAQFKFNTYGFGGWMPDWRNPHPEYADFIRQACKRCEDTGSLTALFMVRPYKGRDDLDITISDRSDIKRLIEVFRIAVDAGAGAVMLRTDECHEIKESDLEEFGSVAAAHAHLANEVNSSLKDTRSDLAFYFMSPYYEGLGVGHADGRREQEDYLRELGELLNTEIQVVWTGPGFRSLKITKEDFDGYVSVLNRTPMLWDNTLYAHRSAYGYDTRHPYYLFDTFKTSYPEGFDELTSGIIYNGGDSDIYKVGRIITADYLWNPDGYKPEPSLWTALGVVAGDFTVAPDILKYTRDSLYGFLDARFSGARLTRDGRSNMVGHLNAVREAWPELQVIVRNQKLISELDAIKSKYEDDIDSIRMIEKEIAKIRSEVILDIQHSRESFLQNVTGPWTIRPGNGYIQMSSPRKSVSQPGAKAEAHIVLSVPNSPTGRYYLLLSSADSVDSEKDTKGLPAQSVFKQAFVNGDLVWEDDVVGHESLFDECFQLVDVTALFAGKQSVVLTLRAIDIKGVSSLWTDVYWGDMALLSSAFPSR